MLPDSNITPGAFAITSKQTVCTTKWSKDERLVTAKMKRDVYAEYGTRPGVGLCVWKPRTTKTGKQVKEACEIDHLISPAA